MERSGVGDILCLTGSTSSDGAAGGGGGAGGMEGGGAKVLALGTRLHAICFIRDKWNFN